MEIEKNTERETCPFQTAADQIGDRWTLLVLRELFEGRTSFVRIVESLGIARNILSSRLSQLQENKIISAISSHQDHRQIHYRLTQKGLDLIGILAALRLWGERWGAAEETKKNRLIEAKSKRPLISVGFKLDDQTWIEPNQIALKRD